ncbi:laminin G domain-containing protein [Dactylosporangium sp. NPDC049525]|uniref:laminin G domain-containing protein n=1 Tax=Dactylosporangium sp. NPDC049525 TaxID=3154730 RepID=UPI0034329060
MIPPLDDLIGDWLDRGALAHLPSLRNQWGQAHVNDDLTSLSWLAMPPYSGGYHTGVLRVDGRAVRADRLRWAPWGVRRAGAASGLTVETDTRLGYEQHAVHWRTRLVNRSAEPVTVTVEQELHAPIADSPVDWGWLYGTPWSAGHHHDYYTTERIRAEVLAWVPRHVHLLATDPRWLRLGSPRIPGIQRDEDTAPMLLESELPDHSTSDSGRTRAPSALGTVRGVTVLPDSGTPVVVDGEFELTDPATERRLEPVALGPDTVLRLEFRPAADGQTGVVLTHGNHPDSVQLGLTDGRPWLRIAGEHVTAGPPLRAGQWHLLSVRITGDGAELSVDGTHGAWTQPWWGAQRWTSTVSGAQVVVTDRHSPAVSVYAFAEAPDELVPHGGGAVARWTCTVEPDATVELGVVLAISSDRDRSVHVAEEAATGFAGAFAAVADRWRSTWTSAFTPGNTEFSGHLPVLHDAPAGLARTYHLGVLLAIYLRNTGVSPIGPVFLTGGPRLGPTTTYFWDQSEWAHTAAMLEPTGTRAWIVAALSQPYDRCHSFDTRNLLPVGNHYAANDHALFRTVQAYLAVTGDLDLLAEKAGTATVLDHLRALAYRPRERRATFGGGVLVDFGRDAWELLECVPNYRDAVVSFNAGYAGMLRSLATLLRRLAAGAPGADLNEEADRADADAAELTAAVLGQYAGGGRWNIAHPEGDETIGHVLDFVFVAAELAEHLSEDMRAEMIQFVTGHLLDGDWMRALAPDDPIAPRSDRPDHGAAGAFGAWPGATAYGLCRLGRPDLATDLLSRIHASTSGAVWGQAMETVGGGRFRVAERGVANRDSLAGAAATEAILVGLFGLPAGSAAGGHVPGIGTLHHVRVPQPSPHPRHPAR